MELRVKLERFGRRLMNSAVSGAYQRWKEMWTEAKAWG